MIEKRYKMKCHEINSWYIEKDGKVIIFDLFKSDAEKLYTELNSLADENEQLKSIKKFAENNGINIFNIDEAFRKCWKDNGELIKKNDQLEREKERYKRLSEIRNENINNRILSLKEFINNCEDEKVKNTLEDFFYSEMNEYDLAKENRELKNQNEQLKQEKEELLDKLLECQKALFKKEIRENPHWHNYKDNEGYTAKVDLDIRFLGGNDD